ncbi:MAG: hypothetical protein ND866_13300 [Pyrinomonadaceae bacterium]|nr:hypothetical protein [Pyrinomonadaceae bacterium]
MSTFAQRKEQSAWFEPSDMNEVSPASMWAPDDEEENARRKARVNKTPESSRRDVNSEPGLIDTPSEIEVPSSGLWTSEELVQPQAHERTLEDVEALPGASTTDSEDTLESICVPADLREEAEALPTNASSMSVATQQEEITSPFSEGDESEGLPHEALVTPAALRQNTTPRTLVLDESAVLPSEASFATVALRQEIPRRPRVLDESAVLPGEASFATVRLYQTPPRSYSRSNGFAANFRPKRLLPALLIIAVCSAAIIFRQKFKTASDFQSPSAESTTTKPSVLQTEEAIPQTKVEATSNSTKPAPVSSSPNEPTGAPLVTDTAVQDKPAVTSEPPVQIVSKNETKRKVGPTKTARPDSNSSGVATKDATTPKSVGGDSPDQNASRAETEPVANTANDARKAEAESQPVAAGGGERPRRVSQPTESQTNPSGTASPPRTKPSKPKVIQWP